MSLAHVSTFRVPSTIIEQTEGSLRAAGADGFELFVLWSGLVHEDAFLVQEAHVPKQSSYKTCDGLMVRVEADALHAMNVWLYRHRQLLGVQVHAHPTEAFHSATDNTYPIVSAEGSLSIVAADFCADGLLHASSAAYKLDAQGWIAVEPATIVQVMG